MGLRNSFGDFFCSRFYFLRGRKTRFRELQILPAFVVKTPVFVASLYSIRLISYFNAIEVFFNISGHWHAFPNIARTDVVLSSELFSLPAFTFLCPGYEFQREQLTKVVHDTTCNYYTQRMVI